MVPRTRTYVALIVALLMTSPAWAGSGANPQPPPCKDCKASSTFSPNTNVARNQIVAITMPPEPVGPTVEISLQHDPARDWDGIFANQNRDLKHDFHFAIQAAQFSSTGITWDYLDSWDLRIDWDHGGTFDADEVVSTHTGMTYHAVDEPRLWRVFDTQTGQYKTNHPSESVTTLTISARLPTDTAILDAEPRSGAYAYRLQWTGRLSDNSYVASNGYNYGVVYIPTLATFSSKFGKNWFSSYDRHLEATTLAYDGTNHNVVLWVNGSDTALPFLNNTSGALQYVQPNAARGSQYQLRMATGVNLAQCGTLNGNETLWELINYGPGSREYYYPLDSAFPGKLRAIVDKFGYKVVFSYNATTGLLEKITDALCATWYYDYGFIPGDLTIDYYRPGLNPPATSTLQTKFHRDSLGRLDSWIAPAQRATQTATETFSYGNSGTYLQNRITRKTGLDRPDVDYTYNGITGTCQDGYLDNIRLANDNARKTTYDYTQWAETCSDSNDYKPQKRIVTKSPEDNVVGSGRTGRKDYIMGEGWIWKTESTSDASTPKVVTETQFYWRGFSDAYGLFAPAQVITSDASGNILPYAGAQPTRTVYAGTDSWSPHRLANLPESLYDAENRLTTYTYKETLQSGCTPPSGYIYAAADPLVVTDPTGNHVDYAYECTGDAYYPANRPISITDELGKVTTYAYDSTFAYNQVFDTTPPGSNGYIRRHYYLLSETNCSNGQFPGALKQVSDQERTAGQAGNRTVYTYDCTGNVAGVASLDTDLGQTERRKKLYEYDLADNMTKVTEKVLSPYSGSDNVTDYVYDQNARLLQVIERNNSSRYNEYVYDTNKLGLFLQDRRCTPGIPPTCRTYYTYTYDLDGHMKSRTDANGITLYEKYDARGRRVQESNWDPAIYSSCQTAQCWQETYDYTVDSLPRHIFWDYKMPPYSGDVTNDIWYWYDFDEACAPSCAELFSGKLRAVSTKMEAGGQSGQPWRHVVYTYQQGTNTLGLLSKREIWKDADQYWFGGTTATKEDFWVDYTYDARQAPSVLTAHFPASTTEALRYFYRDDGLVASKCEWNGTSCSGWSTGYDYWRNGWLKSITHAKTGMTLPKLIFGQSAGGSVTGTVANGYDLDGNRLRVDEWMNPTTYTNTYTYDGFNRLLNSSLGADSLAVNHTYDAIGNIATRSRNGTTTSYVYDYLNQLQTATTCTPSCSTINYCYDQNGNLVYRGTGTCASTPLFIWDYKNRLIQNNADGLAPKEKLAYDPLGYHRTWERHDNIGGTVRTNFLFDDMHGIAAYDVNGDVMDYDFYGQGSDELVSKWGCTNPPTCSTGTRYDYMADGVGSIVRILNTSAPNPRVYRHEPYGVRTNSSSAYFDRFGFTGREYDAYEGHALLWYRARWYDPEVGRFLSRDPVRSDATRYAYARENPIRFNDPSGLDPTGCGHHCLANCSGQLGSGGGWNEVCWGWIQFEATLAMAQSQAKNSAMDNLKAHNPEGLKGVINGTNCGIVCDEQLDRKRRNLEPKQGQCFLRGDFPPNDPAPPAPPPPPPVDNN